MKVIVFRWVTSRESARSSSLHRDGLAVEHCGWLNLHISRISRAEHSVGKAVAGRKTAHVTLVNLETDAHVDCCWSRRIVFQALRRCSGARLRASLTSNLRFARGSEEEAAVQVRPPPAPVTSRHRAWALSGDRSGPLRYIYVILGWSFTTSTVTGSEEYGSPPNTARSQALVRRMIC